MPRAPPSPRRRPSPGADPIGRRMSRRRLSLYTFLPRALLVSARFQAPRRSVGPLAHEPPPDDSRSSSVLLASGVFAGTASAAVPRLIFPVVAKASYTDDFGAPRWQGRHEGNDLMAAQALAGRGGRARAHRQVHVVPRGRLHALPLRQERHDSTCTST